MIDTPLIVLDWQDIYAEAYHKALPELQRMQSIMDATPKKPPQSPASYR